MNKLEELLASSEYILLDGAMGTMLFSSGLENGASPEEWNISHPDRIRAVHRRYIDAGSRVILTNTFGGTRFRLKLHGLDDRVVEVNERAAKLARSEANAAPHLVVVAGSMGPSGELLAPMGTMTFEQARDAFAEQAEGLAAGGVDVFWVETMSDINEVRAAVAGARLAGDLPVVATMSFDTHGRTMMGVSPVQAAEALSDLDLFAFGANCGANLADTEMAIQAMRQVNPQIPLIIKPNAGIPHWEGADLIYDGTPEVMAGYARRARGLGAQLIGTCCGSTSAHTKAMAESLLEGPVAVDPAEPVQLSEANVEGANGGRPRRRRRRAARSKG
jgi:5-methyltetrahydrofolate--homocysteine methyltransferase